MLVFVGVRAIPGDPAIALGAENRDPAVIAAIRHSTGSTGRCRCSTCTGSGSPCTAISVPTSAQLPVAHTIVTRLPITLELALLAC